MIFLYHANCTDGAGAALAAWMKYGDFGHSYISVQYGEDPPSGLVGEDVVIMDFSYSRKTLVVIGRIANSLLLIDHHKSAKVALTAPWPADVAHKITVRFDQDHSGAVLAWREFHKNTPVPLLLAHIEDRDLWRFKLIPTRDAIAGLRLQPDWRAWRLYVERPYDIRYLSAAGANINTMLETEAKKITDALPRLFPMTGDVVPMYNIPGFMLSDTLALALTRYPDSPYAVGYFELPDRRVYSLRSRQGQGLDAVDVSLIAEKFGGGGHRCAAGFSVAVVIDSETDKAGAS